MSDFEKMVEVIERELDVAEMLDASSSTLRRLKAQRIAKAITDVTNEWQPIETAKDGPAAFLAYDVRTGKMDVCEMMYTPTGRPYVMTIEPNQEYGPEPEEFGYDSGDIKFWMPLPSPPSSAASSSPAHPSEQPTENN